MIEHKIITALRIVYGRRTAVERYELCGNLASPKKKKKQKHSIQMGEKKKLALLNFITDIMTKRAISKRNSDRTERPKPVRSIRLRVGEYRLFFLLLSCCRFPPKKNALVVNSYLRKALSK